MTNAIRQIQSFADWDSTRKTLINLIVGLESYNIDVMEHVLTIISVIDYKVSELDGLAHNRCNSMKHNPIWFSTLLAEVNTAIDEVDKAMTFLILADRSN